MESITRNWGIEDVNIFASATLQRPYSPNKAVHLGHQIISNADVYRMQMVAKERVRKFLSDTEKIPKELIFVGRNLNLVRGNNKFLGSPVNRVNIMVKWAVKSEGSDWSFWDDKKSEKEVGSATKLITHLKQVVYPRMNFWVFRIQLAILSLSFHITRTIQRIGEFITGTRWAGFEDVMDQKMTDALKQKMGIVVSPESFSA